MTSCLHFDVLYVYYDYLVIKVTMKLELVCIYFFNGEKNHKSVPSDSSSFTGLPGGFSYAADMSKYMVIITGVLIYVCLVQPEVQIK